MAVTRQKFFPYTVTIDGQSVRLRLKRLSPSEFEEYRAMLSALGQKRGAPASMGDESITATLEDVRAEVAYMKANAAWQEEVFEAYVTVEEGDVIDGDLAVSNGRQFAAMFPGHPMLAAVLAELYLSNALTDEQKKTLQSRSGSATGSRDAPSPELSGPTPATVVERAERAPSVSGEAAMAPSSDKLSGTTDPSFSEVVPCAI
jgi:hypothetical protein